MTDPRFSRVAAEYDSASGLYKSEWNRDAEKVVYRVTVPFDCEANFVPEADGVWTMNGAPVSFGSEGVALTAGEYEFIRQL